MYRDYKDILLARQRDLAGGCEPPESSGGRGESPVAENDRFEP